MNCDYVVYICGAPSWTMSLKPHISIVYVVYICGAQSWTMSLKPHICIEYV
jgi:hypothetical protein